MSGRFDIIPDHDR